MPRALRATMAFALATCTVLEARPAFADPPLEVVVQGEPASTAPEGRDPTAATTVLRRERLRAAGKSTAEVLSEVVGAQVAQTGGGAELATAALRGTSSAQTPIYLAGIRLNDDVTGTADLSTVPPWMLHHIEVYRGSAPFSADRLGVGGAVFLEPSLPRGAGLGGGGELGSFGHRVTWAGLGLGDRRAAAMLSMRRATTEGDFEYVDDRGTRFDDSDDVTRRRPNADAATTDVWAVGRAAYGPPGAGHVTWLVSVFDREQGVTGLAVIPAELARARIRRLVAGARSVVACGDRCRLELVTSALRARLVVNDEARELGLGTDRLSNEGVRVGQEVRATYAPVESTRVGLSLAQAFSRLSLDRDGGADLRAWRSESRAAVEVQLAPVEEVVVYGLSSASLDATTAESGDADLVSPTARAGVRVSPVPWWSGFGNVVRAVRVPTLGELYGPAPAVRGNPALDAERALGADLGTKLAGGADVIRAEAELVGFARWTEDLIAFRRTSVGAVQPFNVARARVMGVEASGWLDAWDHVRTELAATLLDPRDTAESRIGGDDLVPYLARLTLVPALEVYTRSGLEALTVSRASLRGVLHHRASRIADEAGLVVLPSRTTLDIELSVGLLRDRITAHARAANLTDDRSTDLVGFPLPGRSFYVGVDLWVDSIDP